VGRVLSETERLLLELLRAAEPALLSEAELSRELGRDVERELREFHGSGVVHCLSGDERELFWLTRAASLASAAETRWRAGCSEARP
jgi:predicted transcriptional regulator